ncbi:hypothetical protein [Rhodococcus wratislaviensis]|uniref:hypothetical protein n=1 Tax=Rhodococcus wratislaviensis TaxID=44752 RepID=UPI001CEC3C85|nr:hypothetical protein [Rhodococcus wratislaviensis]
MTGPVELGVEPAPRRRRGVMPAWWWVIGAVAAVGMFAMIASVIWPGQAVYLAPVFCAQPTDEAIVVSDTYTDGDGTSTNFALYCVGDRGQTIDEGWLRPFLLLWAAYLVVVAVVFSVVRLSRRPHRNTDQED